MVWVDRTEVKEDMTSTAESWETGLDNKLDALKLEDTQQAGGAALAREGAK